MLSTYAPPANTEAPHRHVGHPGFDLAGLSDWLRHAGLDPRGLNLRVLAGGQSDPTFLLEMASGAMVLRKQPPGQLLPSAHAIDREYRVMKALAGSGVPVPRMQTYCADAEVIGTPFFLMEFVKGRSFVDPTLPGLS